MRTYKSTQNPRLYLPLPPSIPHDSAPPPPPPAAEATKSNYTCLITWRTIKTCVGGPRRSGLTTTIKNEGKEETEGAGGWGRGSGRSHRQRRRQAKSFFLQLRFAMISVNVQFSIILRSHRRVVTLEPLPTIPLFTAASAPLPLLSQDAAPVPAGGSEEMFAVFPAPSSASYWKKTLSFCQSTRPTVTLRNSVSEQKVWRVHAASARRRSGPEHFHALGGFYSFGFSTLTTLRCRAQWAEPRVGH